MSVSTIVVACLLALGAVQEGGCPSGRESVDSVTGESVCNPVPYTGESITRGKKHYLRHCQSCHGFDGRALENIDFEASDLTAPREWRFGTSDADLFRTTKDGAGDDMPPFGMRLRDPQIWELVNYLRSIGPQELQPEQAGGP
ncbi:MAG TPA: c-type cytochrome [Thermoanaerobaculia bacterium]|nr:c-type cytochrome [Thermoanaerobaculia bacterium]